MVAVLHDSEERSELEWHGVMSHVSVGLVECEVEVRPVLQRIFNQHS